MKVKLKALIVLMLCLAVLACSKDDDNNQNENNADLDLSEGITTADLNTYKGQIGISISARDLAVKGYAPATATFTVSEEHNTIEETIEFDEDINVAQFSLEAEGLSQERRDELEDGVIVSVDIKDENDSVLATQTYTNVRFQANPNSLDINAEALPDSFIHLKFRERVKHYIQIVEADGSSDNSAMFVNFSSDLETWVQQRNGYDFNDDNTGIKLHQFVLYEIPGQPGVFAISANVTGNNPLLIKIFNNTLIQEDSINPENYDLSLLDDHSKFRIVKNPSNGLYTLRTLASDTPLRKNTDSGATRFNDLNNTNDPILYVRILTLDIDWTVTSLDTRHLPPILPAPVSDFAFNTKYTNCSQGVGSDTKMVTHTETKIFTVSFEESLSMTSRNSQTTTSTIGMSANASFFGVGFEVSSENSISNTTETEITNTSTQGNEESISEEIVYSTTRFIEVNPGTATNVYDAYQVYQNIRVPFIQRYEIRGSYINDPTVDPVAGPLTGEEIATQYLQSNAINGGIITEFGTDYIEVTIRGTNTLADVYETISRAEDADPNCNN